MSTASTRKKTTDTLIIHFGNRCGRLYVNRIVEQFGVQLCYEAQGLEVQHLLGHWWVYVVLWSWMSTGVVWLHLDGAGIVAQRGAKFVSALEETRQYLPLFLEGTPALYHLPDSNLSDCVAKETS